MSNQPKKKPLNEADQARKALPRHFRHYPMFALVLINVLCYTWVKTYITIDNLGESDLNLSEEENQKLRGERTTKWLRHKNEELNYAAVIGGLLASVISASISWPKVDEGPWVVRALWYASLTLVITSVLVAFQQVAGLGALLATRSNHYSIHRSLMNPNPQKQDVPHRIKVVALQIPVQLLSYSIFCYTSGLAVHIIYPAVKAGGWSHQAKTAVLYSVSFLMGTFFFFINNIYSLEMLEIPELDMVIDSRAANGNSSPPAAQPIDPNKMGFRTQTSMSTAQGTTYPISSTGSQYNP
ncbi:hypothetical protein BZA77DRAFT_389480 [Pyronema omphalodes]|nr:hypothetical protein BZA77DRAFT_389480 [Pyronema omphalodes]